MAGPLRWLTLCALLLCWARVPAASEELEVVSDKDMLSLIQTEKYVVVLFSKMDCKPCIQLEKELAAIRGDLVDSLGAWVIKALRSPLAKVYSPDGEPAIVFFRQGIPMLYEGPANEDNIHEALMLGREPAVKELTDDTFEHLTQAATGATTGDWLVMFYSQDCVLCNRLRARWESLASQLSGRVNIAMVNAKGLGVSTGRRFEIKQYPSFVMFHLGKLYRYTMIKYDAPTLLSFATGWYKNVPSEKVPAPKTPFDNFLDASLEFLQDNSFALKVIVGSLVILGVVLLITLRRRHCIHHCHHTPVSKGGQRKKE